MPDLDNAIDPKEPILDDGGPNPFETLENPSATVDEQPDGTQDAPPEPVADTPQSAFGDLPFKSNEEIVQAYKNLQTAYANDRIRMNELSQHLQTIAPLLKNIQMEKGRTEAEAEDDVAKSLAAFIENGPNKTFASILEKDLPKRLEPVVKPLDERLRKIEEREARRDQEAEIDRFIAKHKETLTVQDEQALVQIVQTTPWIAKLPTMTDRLDAALDKLIARDPGGYASRGKSATATVVDRNLQAAKNGANLTGGKGGGRGPTPATDEFDAVLARDRDERGRWI